MHWCMRTIAAQLTMLRGSKIQFVRILQSSHQRPDRRHALWKRDLEQLEPV